MEEESRVFEASGRTPPGSLSDDSVYPRIWTSFSWC